MGKIALAHHERLAKRAIKYARTEFEITVPKRLRDDAEREAVCKILEYMNEHGIILFDDQHNGLLVAVGAGAVANFVRREGRRRMGTGRYVEDDSDQVVSDPVTQAVDESGYVASALGELDEQLTKIERDILNLKIEQNLTQAEIQSELQITEYVVTAAFKRFKELLGVESN